jgi:hypothetical protein
MWDTETREMVNVTLVHPVLAAGLPRRTALLSVAFLSAVITGSGGSPPADRTVARPVQQKDKVNYYANAHAYLEQPLEKLGKQIPELKKVQPAANPGQLPEILEKVAGNIDDFLRHMVDLIAQEKITQQKLDEKGLVTASERVQDSYLIVRHGNEAGGEIAEFRMDADGNRVEPVGLNRGFVVTSGFALNCNYFSKAFQRESRFRYLGDQSIGQRDTYVLAFAQTPGKATLFVTMTERGGAKVQLLVQGIAWVDKNNFEIIRMRTDLLAPRPEVGLERQITEVNFSKVQLLDVATPLWLPSDVKVYLGFKEPEPIHGQVFEMAYENKHHYADYRRYRVSVKMKAPE